jgi:hypothetical protein
VRFAGLAGARPSNSRVGGSAEKQKASGGGPREAFCESVKRYGYGLGLDVVVVVLELDEFDDGLVVVVFVFVVSLVSLVFSVVGFTTVVLFSTFFSGAGEVPGATTVSFCSQAARRGAG